LFKIKKRTKKFPNKIVTGAKAKIKKAIGVSVVEV
jgi:hypothetical protein